MNTIFWHDDYRAIWLLEMENEGHDPAYLDFDSYIEDTEEEYDELDW